MNKKIVRGSLAGVAVIAFAAGGGTFASWTDSGTIDDNHVGAGFLRLDLNGQDGSAVAPLNWGRLAPGMVNVRTVWLASNDGDSVPSAKLKATFYHLDDQENSCSSNSERLADPSDCDGNAADTGELSHILSFQTSYYPGLSEHQCATYPTNPPSSYDGYNAFFPVNQGDLLTAASGAGHTYTLNEMDTTDPLILDPGEGICVGFQADWPQDPSNQVSAPYDNDDVAQGDSMSFDVKFTLEQQ
jgi:predicted ribosomally synthesized peptide with SipW-like signal peptide